MYPGTFGTFVSILVFVFLQFFTIILVVLDVFRVSKPTFGTHVFFKGRLEDIPQISKTSANIFSYPAEQYYCTRDIQITVDTPTIPHIYNDSSADPLALAYYTRSCIVSSITVCHLLFASRYRVDVDSKQPLYLLVGYTWSQSAGFGDGETSWSSWITI